MHIITYNISYKLQQYMLNIVNLNFLDCTIKGTLVAIKIKQIISIDIPKYNLMGVEHLQCRNMQVIKVPVYLYCVL